MVELKDREKIFFLQKQKKEGLNFLFSKKKKDELAAFLVRSRIQLCFKTVKWGKSEHLKFFRVVLKLLSVAFSPFLLQKSWYQKFYFLFQDLTDRF